MKINKHKASLFIGLFSLHTLSSCHSIKQQVLHPTGIQLSNYTSPLSLHTNGSIYSTKGGSSVYSSNYTNMDLATQVSILDLLEEGQEKFDNDTINDDIPPVENTRIIDKSLEDYLKKHNYSAKSIQKLLDSGLDVNARNENDLTLLMMSAGSGSVEGTRKVINKGAEINATTKHGYTAIQFALERLHYMETEKQDMEKAKDIAESINLLLDDKVDVCIETLRDYRTTYSYAMEVLDNIRKMTGSIRNITGNIAKRITTEMPKCLQTQSDNRQLVENSDHLTDEIKQELKRHGYSSNRLDLLVNKEGVSINAKDKEGKELLTLAIEAKSVDGVIFLLHEQGFWPTGTPSLEEKQAYATSIYKQTKDPHAKKIAKILRKANQCRAL